jgi:type II secretory ATPase GspE/PulE/Tfp pilus assembly ATPase PilB-like protein
MNNDPYQTAQIQRLALGILAQAQRDRATELVFSTATRAAIPVRYKVNETWHDWSGPPPRLVPEVVAELGRLARFTKRPFPKEGLIDVPYSGIRVCWVMRMSSEDADCILTSVEA